MLVQQKKSCQQKIYSIFFCNELSNSSISWLLPHVLQTLDLSKFRPWPGPKVERRTFSYNLLTNHSMLIVLRLFYNLSAAIMRFYVRVFFIQCYFISTWVLRTYCYLQGIKKVIVRGLFFMKWIISNLWWFRTQTPMEDFINKYLSLWNPN